MILFTLMMAVARAGTCNVSPSGNLGAGATEPTADTRAILDCVNASGTDTIRLAAGTYALNRPIRLRSGQTLRGAGGAATTLRWVGGNATAMVMRSSGAPVVDLTVRDLTLECNRTAHNGLLLDGRPDGTRSDGSTRYDLRRVTVRGVTAAGCNGQGLHVKDANGVFIRDSIAHHNGTNADLHHGIYLLDVTEAFIEGGSTHDNAGRGVSLRYVTDALVSGHFADHNGTDGVRAEASTRVRVHRGRILHNGQGPGHHGVELSPGGSYPAVDWNRRVCVEETHVEGHPGGAGVFLGFVEGYELRANTLVRNGQTVQMVAVPSRSTPGVCGAIPADRGRWPFTR